MFKYNLIIEGFRTDTLMRANYMFYFIMRRFISSMTLIVLIDYPYFQLVILLALSLMNMNYLIGTKPLRDANILELLNEMTIYIVVLMMCNFMNSAMPLQLADQLGWILIGVVACNMIINITVTCVNMLKSFISANSYILVEKKVKKLIAQNITNRVKLIKHFPEDTEYYRSQIKKEKALEYCRKWNEERRWLKASGIDFEHFPEEKQFQNYIKEFNFLPRAYLQRMNKSMKYLATKQTHEDLERRRIRSNFDKNMFKDEFTEVMRDIKAE